MITPRIVVGPIKEPVGISDAMEQCGITNDDDAGKLGKFIAAARSYYEWRTGRTIHEQTKELILDAWPGGDGVIILPRATPLIEVMSIKYVDTVGGEHPVSPSTYIQDTLSELGAVAPAYGQSWPTDALYPVAPIRIQYRCGLEIDSPPGEADEDIQQGVMLLVAAMWENREAEVLDSGSMQKISLQYGIEAFIALKQVEFRV